MDHPEPPYSFKLDDRGMLRSVVRHDDQAEIPVDPSDQDFCDFLTYLTSQAQLPEAYGSLRAHTQPEAMFFSSMARLVADYKKAGLLLCVNESPDGISLQHRERIDAEFLGGIHKFYHLLKPIMPSPDWQVGPDGLAISPAQIFITGTLYEQVCAELANSESDVRCISDWPVEKTFVFVDISDFSTHPAGQQALIINSLIQLSRDPHLWPEPKLGDVIEDCEARLCTGDGYIFVFRQSWRALLYAVHLARIIEVLVAWQAVPEFHFRMGIHTGRVYRFWDWGRGDDGSWNYVGDGINVGSRVISAIGQSQDDVVFISGEARQDILAKGHLRDAIVHFDNRGRRPDKHNVQRRLYEVNHTALSRAVLLPETFDLLNAKRWRRAAEINQRRAKGLV